MSYTARQFLHPLIGGVSPWKPDPTGGTFTAGMAKRATSVFAASPIVQGPSNGGGVSDILSFPRGAQITGHFYANFSGYQSTVILDWTPEYSTNGATGMHYLWYASSAYHAEYDYDNDRYSFTAGTQTLTINATIVAGTRECLAFSFDTTNEIDGTNYLRFSRNDVETFGVAIQPTASAPDATIYVGSNGTTGSGSGIFQQFGVSREVFYDGTDGIDLWFANDVLANHYGAGAGADICLTTGSWGWLFFLPTNSTAGAIVTGSGEAWSHPNSSAELADTFCQTTYGSSAWNTYGTPSAGPADQAAAEKIGPGGYSWTSDAAAEGIESDATVVIASTDYVIRCIADCAQADDIRVVIWDATNAAQIGADFDFGASSSRAAPGVALFVFRTPGTCTSLQVRVLSTAAGQTIHCHQVEVQESLLSGGDMEAGAGNPWIPTGWTNSGLDVGDTETEAAIIHAGVQSMEWNPDASQEGVYQDVGGMAAGNFINIGGWVYGDGSIAWDRFGALTSAYADLQYSANAPYFTTTDAAVWSHNPGIWRGDAVPPLRFNIRAEAGAGGDRFLDDLYAILCDPITLTVTPASAANSLEGTGVRVDGLDSLTSVVPAGFLETNNGDIRWKCTFRHGDTEAPLFGNASPTIVIIWGDANNYLYVSWSAADTMTVAFNANGAGFQSANWATGGSAITPGTEYDMRVRYWAGSMSLYVNGIARATITAPTGFVWPAPTTLYWGSSAAGINQVDAVFSSA